MSHKYSQDLVEGTLDKGTLEKAVEASGSKILQEVMRKVKVEREIIANWAQNWSVHTNHSDNSS